MLINKSRKERYLLELNQRHNELKRILEGRQKNQTLIIALRDVGQKEPWTIALLLTVLSLD